MRRYPTVLVVLALAACSPDYSPNTYNAAAVQQANKVEQGVVIGVRQVGVRVAGTTGAAVGGAAGAIAGSQLPGSGTTEALGALGGTLIGSVVGSGVEHSAGDTDAYEYVVRTSKGDLISVTQKDDAPLDVGQHVLVIAGTQARIVADYTVSPIEPPKPEPPKPAAVTPPAPTPPTVAPPAVPPATPAPAPPTGPPGVE